MNCGSARTETGNMQAIILIVRKNKTKNNSNFRLSLSNQARFESTWDFQNRFSLYITTFLYACVLIMHCINRPLMLAKEDWRVSWWSVGKKGYQLPRKILDELIACISVTHSLYKEGRIQLAQLIPKDIVGLRRRST